jgi:hypothetical protein
MMQEIKRMRKHWSIRFKFDVNVRTKGMGSHQKLIETFTDGANPNARSTDISKCIQLLTGDVNGRSEWPDQAIRDWARSVAQHFGCQTFLFGLVCITLGLDSRLCRARGLYLVRTISNPLLLGLQKGFRCSTDNFDYTTGVWRKTILMSTTNPKNDHHHTDELDEQYYHLRDVEINSRDEPSKKYKTHIIWVPTSDPSVENRIQGRARLMFERVQRPLINQPEIISNQVTC